MTHTTRIALVSTVLALAACGGRGDDAERAQAAADSAGVPNTQNGALSTTGPTGDSLSSAAGPATVSPGGVDSTRRAPGDTAGGVTRAPQ
jgi:hypothetical protein